MRCARLVAAILLTGFVFTPLPISAQTLLNQPMGIVYDAESRRYLVSNAADGSIVQINAQEEESYFSTALGRAACSHILGNILYVVAREAPYVGVVGFDLATAEIVSYVPIPDSEVLIGICSDSAGKLYVSDCHADRILRVDPQTESYWTFHDFGTGMPYALTYDEAGDRLLTVMQEETNYPLKAVNIADSSMTRIRSTYLPCVDGLAKDGDGYTYMANCSDNTIYRYDENFTYPPEVFSDGHAAPQDIFVNRLHRILAIPNWSGNSVEFLPLNPSAVSEPDRSECLPSRCVNPFTTLAMVEYHLEHAGEAWLEVFDVQGASIGSVASGPQPAGPHRLVWNAAEQPGGAYYYRLRAGTREGRGRMLRIR